MTMKSKETISLDRIREILEGIATLCDDKANNPIQQRMGMARTIAIFNGAIPNLKFTHKSKEAWYNKCNECPYLKYDDINDIPICDAEENAWRYPANCWKLNIDD